MFILSQSKLSIKLTSSLTKVLKLNNLNENMAEKVKIMKSFDKSFKFHQMRIWKKKKICWNIFAIFCLSYAAMQKCCACYLMIRQHPHVLTILVS